MASRLLRWFVFFVLVLSACTNRAAEPLPAPVATTALESTPAPLMTRSFGCAAPRDHVRGESRAVLQGKRTFHVWAPLGKNDRPLRVLFTFHGWTSNGRDFEKWFLMEDHVNGEAIVVYPDSDGSSWDFTGTKDLDFFDAMLADLGDAYCIDPSHVYAFGFSYGGRFTHHLGCQRSDVLRGIAAGGSDWTTKEKGACGRVPVLVTHRTTDGSEPYSLGRDSIAKWAGINGCSPNDGVTDEVMGCRAYLGCKKPVTFCTDTHSDRTWRSEWNHTVREEYRDLTWRWLRDLHD